MVPMSPRLPRVLSSPLLMPLAVLLPTSAQSILKSPGFSAVSADRFERAFASASACIILARSAIEAPLQKRYIRGPTKEPTVIHFHIGLIVLGVLGLGAF